MKQFQKAEQFVVLENLEKGLNGFYILFSFIVNRRVIRCAAELVRVIF